MNISSFKYNQTDIDNFRILTSKNVKSYMDIVVMIKYIFSNRYDYVLKTTKNGDTYKTNVDPLIIMKDDQYVSISIQASPIHYCKPKDLSPVYTHYEIKKPSFLLSDTFTSKYKLYNDSYINVKLEDIAKEIYNYIHNINNDKSEESIYVNNLYNRIMDDGMLLLFELNEINHDGIELFHNHINTIQIAVNDYIDKCNTSIEKGLEYEKSKFFNLYIKKYNNHDIHLAIYHQYNYGKSIDRLTLVVSEYMVNHINLDKYYNSNDIVNYYSNVPLYEAIDGVYNGLMSLRDELLIKIGDI